MKPKHVHTETRHWPTAPSGEKKDLSVPNLGNQNFHQEMENYPKENVDILIPVVGRAGAGKSEFINQVLKHAYGNDLKKEDLMGTHTNLNPCTTAVRKAALQPDSKGRRVVLVDTPGLETSSGSKEKGVNKYSNPFETIANWFRDVDETKSVLAGIIYLHDISRARFTDDIEVLPIFRGLCGHQALTNTIIGTTKWSKEQAPPENKIPDLKEHFQTQLPGTILWKENSDECDEKIVADILDEFSTNFETVRLQIQVEMVERKKEFLATTAGSTYEALNSQRATTNRDIKNIFQKFFGFFIKPKRRGV